MLIRTGASGLIVCLALCGALWMGALTLPVFQVGSMLLFVISGIAITPAAITALDASASAGGTAAASLGTIQLATTATASGIISLFPAFSIVPLMVVLAAAFLGALILSSHLFRMMSDPASRSD